MEENKKKYICILPTNGYQSGDVAYLTDEEAKNCNATEVRFELAAEDSGPQNETPDQPVNGTPPSPPTE